MPYIEYDEIEATCSDCGRIFRSEDALAAHLAEVHRPVEDARIRRTGVAVRKSAVPCPNCSLELASATELRRHRRAAHPDAGPQTAAL